MSAEAAVDVLRARAGTGFRLGLVLGSGLGSIADEIAEPICISYADLPGFPISTVASHAGEVVAGHLCGVKVIILSGRVHYYEGGNAQAMRVPLETLRALGAEGVILTNAAGSLQENIFPGDVVLIADHINFGNSNPLIGEDIKNRFVGMTEAYDARWRDLLTRSASAEGIDLLPVISMWFSGPSFETPAEIRMARALGADVIGMSVVPETILARWLRLKVAGLSAITNFAAGITGEELSHEETMALGPIGAEKIKRIIRQFLARLGDMDKQGARRAIRLLDLTNLNDDCDDKDIADLCAKAQTPYGHTAAVCIWPPFVKRAKVYLAGTGIGIATVVNFPHGGEDVAAVVQKTKAIIEDGADEVDLVIPYRAILEGRDEAAATMVRAVRAICPDEIILKVILETGELQDEALIRRASRIAIAEGADFIKTSTGKVAVNATPDVAAMILEEIAKSGKAIGFKAAGGLKTAADTAVYLEHADRILGSDWATPGRFRFGASSVLNALLAVAEGRETGLAEGY